MSGWLRALRLVSAMVVLAAPLCPADYWISNPRYDEPKTHNSSCRYYRKCVGHASSVGNGRDCKLCGGAGGKGEREARKGSTPEQAGGAEAANSGTAPPAPAGSGAREEGCLRAAGTY